MYEKGVLILAIKDYKGITLILVINKLECCQVEERKNAILCKRKNIRIWRDIMLVPPRKTK